jgi:hypothetical protein
VPSRGISSFFHLHTETCNAIYKAVYDHGYGLLVTEDQNELEFDPIETSNLRLSCYQIAAEAKFFSDGSTLTATCAARLHLRSIFSVSSHIQRS